MSTESLTEELSPTTRQAEHAAENATGEINDLFYYASPSERIQVYFAIVLSCFQGMILPVFTILLATLGGDFNDDDTPAAINAKLGKPMAWMGSFAVGLLLSSFVSSVLWSSLSTSLTGRIKSSYLQSLMRQDTPWFDARKSEEIASNYVHEVSELGVIFSQKLHFYFLYYSQMIAGIVVCLYIGWLFTLAIVLLLPFMAIGLFLYVRGIHKAEAVQKNHESRATMLFENAVSLIKPIKAVCAEEDEVAKFNAVSDAMRHSASKAGYKAGMYWGFVNFSGYMACSLAMLFGFKLLEYRYFNDNAGRRYTANDIISIIFSLLPPITSMGNIGALEQFIRGGAKTARKIIDISRGRKGSEERLPGVKRPEGPAKGDIEFQNVSFAYPSNPKAKVLRDFSMKIGSGEKVAVVGLSGCGKTTIIQLLERFYEPQEGKITLDGIDIRELDPHYLRSKIGLVSQQSLLFTGSVRENLLLGSEDTHTPDERLWDILEKVNAKTFVEKLPGKLSAQVGGPGGLLSNGQKQKLSIARSLLKDPAILLFDEATNFLDKQEEEEVRRAIDAISVHCTSIVIDHKMGKIQSADMVYVLDHGVLVESGTPAVLLAKKGSLYEAAVHQKDSSEESGEENVLDVSMDSRVGQNNSNRNILKFVESSAAVQDVPLPEEATPSPGEQTLDSLDTLPWKTKVLEAFKGSQVYLWWAILITLLNGLAVTSFGFLIARIRVEFFSLTDLQAQADSGLDPAPSGNLSFLEAKSLQKSLDESFILLFVVGLLTFLLNFLQLGLFTHIAEHVVSYLRSQYFRRLMYLDVGFFDHPEFHPGHLALSLNKATGLVKTGLNTSLGSLLQMTASFSGGFIIVSLFSVPLAIVGAAVTLVILFFKNYESRFTGHYSMLSREVNLKVLTETLGNMRTVRSLNAEDKMVGKFSEVSPDERRKRLRMSLLAGLVFGFSQLINYIGYGALFAFGIVYRDALDVTISGVMTCFLTMAISMYGIIVAQEHIAGFGQAVKALKTLTLPLFYVSEIEVDPTTADEVPRKAIVNWVDKVEFRNVDFRYSEKGRPVLRNFSLVANKGAVVGVFGRSGSGKSAIVELLLRFYEPTSGSILINDLPIQDIDLRQLRTITATLLQDTRLFNDTIDANIRGPKELSDFDVRELAAATNSLNFIFGSPEGFRRVVGQFGQNLSGGQRQRILLSRFFGRLGKISLLDEPTSALDLSNENKILALIEKAKAERVTLIFSSKSTCLGVCDKVAVLSGGRVAEFGSPAELLEKKGKYWALTRK